MKKDYLKPMMEVVEVELSDCIAGSINVSKGTTGHTEIGLGGDKWSAEVETLN